MQTITVLVNDLYPGTPNPLIYTVQVNDPKDDDEVLQAVTTQRQNDLESTDEVELELLIAFQGDPAIAHDWRE